MDSSRVARQGMTAGCRFAVLAICAASFVVVYAQSASAATIRACVDKKNGEARILSPSSSVDELQQERESRHLEQRRPGRTSGSDRPAWPHGREGCDRSEGCDRRQRDQRHQRRERNQRHERDRWRHGSYWSQAARTGPTEPMAQQELPVQTGRTAPTGPTAPRARPEPTGRTAPTELRAQPARGPRRPDRRDWSHGRERNQRHERDRWRHGSYWSQRHERDQRNRWRNRSHRSKRDQRHQRD